MLTIKSFSEGMGEIKFVLEKHGKMTELALARAKKVFRDYLATEPTLQKACEETVAKIERECAAIRKSEADSVAAATSRDFDIGPATPGQQAAAATHALRVQGLANAATRRLQSWGINDPTDDDVTRAIEAVLNVSWTDYEGSEGQRVDSNPAVAARLRDMKGDESIWMDMSNPRQMARPPMDVEAVVSNFEGTRNGFYMHPTRSEMGATNFSSSSGGASVRANAPAPAAGGAVAGNATDLNASAIAAAYQAGLAAGSNFATAKRRGR